MKKNMNKILFALTLVIAVIGAILVYEMFGKDDNNGLSTKNISDEYTLVNKDNVFEYRNITDIVNIFEGGTGIVFLGFPECPWCQYYAKYLNEIAKENNIKKIYYYNIKADRENNTVNYQKIVSVLEDHLFTDDSNKKRIMVPDVTIIKNGKIIAHDNETSNIMDGSSPEEYWTTENVNELRNKLNTAFKTYNTACTTCN